MGAMRRLSPLAIALLGCNLISGVDDYQFGGGGRAATTSTTTLSSTTTGETSSSTSTGGGGCGPDTKTCGDVCAAIDDPAYGCNLVACDPCGTGEACCPGCTNVVDNPSQCGSCTNACDDAEWCVGTSCVCRPGLVVSGQSCIDPLSNPNDCGGNGPCGGGTPLCENGTCVSAC